MAQPQADAQAVRNAAIVALAAAQLAALWPRVDWASPDAAAAVRAVYGAIVTQFGRSAAAVAATTYDQLRATKGLTSEYRAVPADPVPQAVIDKVVDSAFRGHGPQPTSPGLGSADHVHVVETTSDLPVEQRVPARLDAGLQRHVLQPARDTIAENVAADPAKPRYIRVPRGATTCAFCILLASRAIKSVKGAKNNFSGYASKQSALFTENGDKYHTHCDCEAVAIFPDDNIHDLSPNFQDFQDMYHKAAADAGRTNNLKTVLASMRKLHGLK